MLSGKLTNMTMANRVNNLIGAALLAGGMVFAVSPIASAEVIKPKAVVELFTSQGCYSCPPADKVIEKFANGDDVLGLSIHVDYWDYLGWKDSFASKANTQRQYAYASSMGERQVYTPQAVVNGRTHVVGSREKELRQTIDYFVNSNKGLTVPIDAKINNESLSIGIEKSSDLDDATLYLFHFNREEEVDIKRGENAGKKLKYFNVVHEIQVLGMVKGNGLQLEFPMSEIKRNNCDSIALVLQKKTRNGDPSNIIGAVVIADYRQSGS